MIRLGEVSKNWMCMTMADKENAYIIRGGQGGIIVAFILILTIVAVNMNNLSGVTSKDAISYYLLEIIILIIMGAIAGKRYLEKKPTAVIWTITYTILYSYSILPNVMEIISDKLFFAYTMLLIVFVVLLAECTDYIWRLWIKGIDARHSQ